MKIFRACLSYRFFLAVLVLVLAGVSACQLVADFDRSKIGPDGDADADADADGDGDGDADADGDGDADADADGDGDGDADCDVPEDCPETGDFCLDRTCNGGVCGTTTHDCGDSVDCTDDACAAGACTHTPNSGLCVTDPNLYCDLEDGCVPPPPCVVDEDCEGNGDFCAPETCVNLACVQGANPCVGVDEDTATCTVASCDESTDTCPETPDHASCDDVSQCTTDTCDPADGAADAVTGCVNETVDCDDSADCTTDSCDDATGCVNAEDDADCPAQPNQCVTAGSGVCDPGAGGALEPSGCTYGARVCNDNKSCTTDGCNLGTGCTTVNNSAACPGESGDDCTLDGTGVCDPADLDADPTSGCAYTDRNCADAFTCTAESCIAPGSCQVTPHDGACTDVNPNTADTCDPAATFHDSATGCTGLTCALLCAGTVTDDCSPTECALFVDEAACLAACAGWNGVTATCVDTTSRTGTCQGFIDDCGLAGTAGTDCP